MATLRMLTLCPCSNVRRTCRMVVEANPHVQINQSKVKALAQELLQSASSRKRTTEWDEHGWHYTSLNVAKGRQERVALYVMALDAINFCFWPHPKAGESNTLEYDHLAVALRKLAELDEETQRQYFFHPQNLAQMTQEKMSEALKPHLQGHHLPNIKERCRLWNELGCVLLQFGSSALKFIQAAQNDAPKLVQLFVQNMPGFRDESLYQSEWVAFYKRAQIVVGDLNAALCLNLENMDQLTTFADYRVPQVLRHYGILEYSKELSDVVDSNIEIVANSEHETAIRAATVVSVDDLVGIVNSITSENKVTAVLVDWHLWQLGETMNQQGQLKPYHRVRTIYY